MTQPMIDYARAVVAWRDAVDAAEARRRAELEAAGYVIVNGGQESSWTEDADGVKRCEEHYYVDATGETIHRGRVATFEESESILKAYEARAGVKLYHADHIGTAAFEETPEPEPPPGIPSFLADAISQAEPDQLRAWINHPQITP